VATVVSNLATDETNCNKHITNPQYSPKPPVLILLYCSMRRAVSLLWLSYCWVNFVTSLKPADILNSTLNRIQLATVQHRNIMPRFWGGGITNH